MNNLSAFVLREEGEPVQAEPFARESLAIRLKNQGPDHPQVAAASNTLARVLEAEGDYTGAESQFGQALDIVQRTVGLGSYVGAQILLNHSMLEFDRGRYPAAEKEAREALDALRKLGGEKTPYVALALTQVAEDRVFPGRCCQRGSPCCAGRWRVRGEENPPAHPEIIFAEVRLGEALTASGELREAEQILRATLNEARSAPFALSAWRIAEIQSALGICLAAESLTHEGRRSLLEESQNGLRSGPASDLRQTFPPRSSRDSSSARTPACRVGLPADARRDESRRSTQVSVPHTLRGWVYQTLQPSQSRQRAHRREHSLRLLQNPARGSQPSPLGQALDLPR